MERRTRIAEDVRCLAGTDVGKVDFLAKEDTHDHQVMIGKQPTLNEGNISFPETWTSTGLKGVTRCFG